MPKQQGQSYSIELAIILSLMIFIIQTILILITFSVFIHLMQALLTVIADFDLYYRHESEYLYAKPGA